MQAVSCLLYVLFLFLIAAYDPCNGTERFYNLNSGVEEVSFRVEHHCIFFGCSQHHCKLTLYVTYAQVSVGSYVAQSVVYHRHGEWSLLVKQYLSESRGVSDVLNDVNFMLHAHHLACVLTKDFLQPLEC